MERDDNRHTASRARLASSSSSSSSSQLLGRVRPEQVFTLSSAALKDALRALFGASSSASLRQEAARVLLNNARENGFCSLSAANFCLLCSRAAVLCVAAEEVSGAPRAVRASLFLPRCVESVSLAFGRSSSASLKKDLARWLSN